MQTHVFIHRWWKDFKSKIDLRFARDRLVELHFWMLGVIYEPYFSRSRIMLTKFTLLVSLFDDFYDSGSTTEESSIFTNAIERFAYPVHLKLFTAGMNKTYELLKFTFT